MKNVTYYYLGIPTFRSLFSIDSLQHKPTLPRATRARSSRALLDSVVLVPLVVVGDAEEFRAEHEVACSDRVHGQSGDRKLLLCDEG